MSSSSKGHASGLDDLGWHRSSEMTWSSATRKTPLVFFIHSPYFGHAWSDFGRVGIRYTYTSQLSESLKTNDRRPNWSLVTWLLPSHEQGTVLYKWLPRLVTLEGVCSCPGMWECRNGRRFIYEKGDKKRYPETRSKQTLWLHQWVADNGSSTIG